MHLPCAIFNFTYILKMFLFLESFASRLVTCCRFQLCVSVFQGPDRDV